MSFQQNLNTNKWQKQGLIIAADNNFPWMCSQTGFPTPLLMNDRIRIFFSSYAESKQARIGYVDVEKNNPSKIIQISENPVIDLGAPGTFDDSGVNPGAAVWNGDEVYLYYQGWNPLKTTPHRLNIGLAISKDGGNTFAKYSPAPLFDRTREEPIFSNNPFVMKEGNLWHMWYMVVNQWLPINGRLEATHTIYYAHSDDGIHWQRDNIRCIVPVDELECISNATVIKENGIYKMWYCYRGIIDFRISKENSYRIGYAESKNARDWVRLDDHAGLEISNEGWDSQMLAFPAVLDVEDKRYMFYNGNGFGQSGFGFAVCDKA